jgi:hypothetical protein
MVVEKYGYIHIGDMFYGTEDIFFPLINENMIFSGSLFCTFGGQIAFLYFFSIINEIMIFFLWFSMERWTLFCEMYVNEMWVFMF